MASLVTPLTFLAAIGAGLNAGLFFIFSVCIMAAFARLAPSDGIAAMNAINAVIQNPYFFLAFFGTALASLVLIVLAFVAGGAGSLLIAAGGFVFLVGVIGVTVAFNVPMNEQLAGISATSADGVEFWKRYLTDWTAWNHARTIASMLSLALFILGYGRAA